MFSNIYVFSYSQTKHTEPAIWKNNLKLYSEIYRNIRSMKLW